MIAGFHKKTEQVDEQEEEEDDSSVEEPTPPPKKSPKTKSHTISKTGMYNENPPPHLYTFRLK